MTEQEQLERIAELEEPRWERMREEASSPGRTEREAIFYLAVRGGLYGWFGIALAGAVLGTPFFLVGAVPGFVFGGVAGAIPVAVAASLFVVTRGRIPLPFIMAWSGAVAGITFRGLFMPTGHGHSIFWFPAELTFAFVLGLPGAIGAGWMTRRGLQRIRVKHGLGSRQWRRFQIMDLLLITTWVAIACAIAKVLFPWGTGGYFLAALWLALSIVIAAMAEGLRLLIHNVRNQPPASSGRPRST